MKWVRACAIAFSLYSRIPMPQFTWEEQDMNYVLCFFPWIGAVIGLCLYGWMWLGQRMHMGPAAMCLFGTALPVLLTGGFHVDGFMDTMDALHSYQSRERKLEILKDSHIGAFSVIMLLVYYLVYLAAFSEIKGEKAMAVAALGFVLSRCLSGIGAVILRPAKPDGLLRTVVNGAERKTVLPVLVLQLILCAAGMILLSPLTGGLALAGAAGSFFYYRHRIYREFGGITGDTAGYFLLLCEGAVVIAAALGGVM